MSAHNISRNEKIFIKHASGRFYQTFFDPLQYWFLREDRLLIDVLHKGLHVFVRVSEAQLAKHLSDTTLSV